MKPKSYLSLILGALLLPVFTGGAQTVTRISAGYFQTLFVKSDGSLWGMGHNYEGELGDSIFATNFPYGPKYPEQIVSSNVTTVSAGYYHSLFLTSDGSLWGMGANYNGQLGDGTFTTDFPYGINVPEQVVPSNVTAISAGGYHSLFLKSDGSLWAMGANPSGALGDGTYNDNNRPERIVSSGVTAISAGYDYSLFLKSDGSLWGMGNNNVGQLGDGTYNNTNRPKMIVASGVTAIAAELDHSFFIKNDGSLWGMGDNAQGRLGDGSSSVDGVNVPEKIVSNNVTAIAGGYSVSLFLKTDGSLWDMGYNEFGELGDGSGNNAYFPEQIVASNVTAISAGEWHSLFLKKDGTLWGMGYNGDGQLGLGTIDSVSIPAQILPVSLLPYYGANIVANSGFETGDLSGWNSFGNVTSDTLVSTQSSYVHSGGYGLQSGPVGSLFYLFQYLPTRPGATYLVSFWLNSPDGATPNEFVVSCGTTVLDKTNFPATGWTNIQFTVMATEISTDLQFEFRGDHTYFGLDDISVTRNVQPVVTGTKFSGANLTIQASNGLNGVTYHTLMSTNVANPLSQWTPIATNVLSGAGNFTVTVTNAVNPLSPQRFYLLQSQ
jgi:alpha-tubulin suppressor-like RCC1 family protein